LEEGAQSVGSISYTCYYQAATPGIHNPDSDSFLGCDVYASVGVDTTNVSTVIAAHRGAPVDGGTCSGSPEAIGDTISISGTPDTSVADMNALWNGNKVIGWLYKGDNGVRFIQLNYQNAAGQSAGVSLGLIGASVASPGGYSGIGKWNGSLPPGTRVKKCFTGGQQFV
jgi:hypothetical protein